MTFAFEIQDLPERHQLGLRWFQANEGLTLDFPDVLSSGQFLATKAKGIYKPADWLYALSIRIMLSSPYEDGEFFALRESGWVCAYHQEDDTRDLSKSNDLFTNRSLQSCLEEKVPVGILKQTQSKNDGGSKYKVIGLGAVIAKIGSYFVLADIDSAKTIDTKDLVEELLRHEAESRVPAFNRLQTDSNQDIDVDVGDAYREKIRVWAQIVRRQGQGKFRENLLRAYGSMCCITNTAEKSVLDAAHITPYNGPATNLITNGILLRTDLHALFDLNLLGIEPGTLRVFFHASIIDQNYKIFETTQIRVPELMSERPDVSNLTTKWKSFSSSYLA